MPYLYWDPTMLLIIPGVLIALWAQMRVQSTFARYSALESRAGVPAAKVVRRLLNDNDLAHIAVQPVRGSLTDHYNPRKHTLALSEPVYGSSSLAALGIAAHEAGHALQHRDHYAPLKLRNFIVPVASVGSYMAWPLLILGLVLAWQPLVVAGVALFSLAVIFQLITLPVEFNASRRALAMLRDGGYVTQEELPAARSVLSAAALTYVAAALMAVLQLLRLLLLSGLTGRRRD